MSSPASSTGSPRSRTSNPNMARKASRTGNRSTGSPSRGSPVRPARPAESDHDQPGQQYGQPTQSYEQPQYGSPGQQYGEPQYGEPQYGRPEQGQPYGQQEPDHDQPVQENHGRQAPTEAFRQPNQEQHGQQAPPQPYREPDQTRSSSPRISQAPHQAPGTRGHQGVHCRRATRQPFGIICRRRAEGPAANLGGILAASRRFCGCCVARGLSRPAVGRESAAAMPAGGSSGPGFRGLARLQPSDCPAMIRYRVNFPANSAGKLTQVGIMNVAAAERGWACMRGLDGDQCASRHEARTASTRSRAGQHNTHASGWFSRPSGPSRYW